MLPRLGHGEAANQSGRRIDKAFVSGYGNARLRTAAPLTQDVPEVVSLRRYLTVGAVFFAFLFGMLADYMMFDAERAKILDQLGHDRAVVQQYRMALEKTR